MADSGSGEPRAANADLGALPDELVRQSISRSTIILPLDAALSAIEYLTARGRRLENWEGWVKMRDGGRAKSLSHGGSFALPRDAARAAQVASDRIRHAHATWARKPEYDNAQLYFGLTFGSES